MWNKVAYTILLYFILTPALWGQVSLDSYVTVWHKVTQQGIWTWVSQILVHTTPTGSSFCKWREEITKFYSFPCRLAYLNKILDESGI